MKPVILFPLLLVSFLFAVTSYGYILVHEKDVKVNVELKYVDYQAESGKRVPRGAIEIKVSNPNSQAVICDYIDVTRIEYVDSDGLPLEEIFARFKNVRLKPNSKAKVLQQPKDRTAPW